MKTVQCERRYGSIHATENNIFHPALARFVLDPSSFFLYATREEWQMVLVYIKGFQSMAQQCVSHFVHHAEILISKPILKEVDLVEILKKSY